MSKTSVPPGFRFHPTDVELICYYLKRKIMGKPFHFEAISEIELYKLAPWELPDKSQLRSKDLEWYFFCPRDRKYPNGSRANRATDIGYWKTTGNDRSVIHKSHVVGMKKTLVFHVGKAPKGDRTNWVMYEYRMQDRELVDAGFSQDTHVLCKIFQKSGSGSKIGEQYGAPFNEEDWDDDMIVENFPFPSLSRPCPKSVDNHTVALSSVRQQSRGFDVDNLSSNPDLPEDVDNLSSNPDLPEDDGFSLEQLEEMLDTPQLHSDIANLELFDSTTLHGVGNETSAVNTKGIYDDLEDLSVHPTISDNICYFEYDSENYVELDDLWSLGEGFTPEFVMPNYPSSKRHVACCPGSQNPSNLYNSNTWLDSVVTTASEVGDYLHAGADMIEAFGGSSLNPKAPVFEAQDNETNSILEDLTGALSSDQLN